MSLQLAAKHLAAQGRGPDSNLVHMSPREVAGLQAIAMAHGGSLSINPETGLPEAGFLDKLLPMIIGVGLTAATGGAAAPWMVGLGLGGLETARTGSLSKGLMAGLGAYGGAGIGAGLMGAGAQAAADASIAGNLAASTGEPALAATQAAQAAQATPFSTMGQGIAGLTEAGGRDAFMKGIGGGKELLKYGAAAAAPMFMAQQPMGAVPTGGPNPYQYRFDAGRVANPEEDYTGALTGERRYFNPMYTRFAGGGPVEAMSNANAVGANTGYPMANIQRGAYAVPYQQPMSQDVVTGPQDVRVDSYTGEQRLAGGGLSDLGSYSDGGRLLKGPGDGVSDSIPAVIGGKQPARLADGEFVVPARIVSELGNGSTDAGARKLYAMMDRVQKARGKTTGKDRVAANTRAEKHLPA